MYHYPGDVDMRIVVYLAEQAFFLIKQLVDKLVDLISIKIRRVFSLLKEEGCRVLQFFHLNQKIIMEARSMSCDLSQGKAKEWIERSFAFQSSHHDVEALYSFIPEKE